MWSRRATSEKPPFSSSLYHLDYSLQVALAVRRARPDIVHIHNFTGFVPIIRALNRRSTIVLHMNCEWLSQLDHDLMGKRISQVDAVFGSSDHITNLVRARYPQYADRCHTVYNGVDAQAFRIRDASAMSESTGSVENTILFVGRISPEKGIHDLVDAIPAVLERHPTTRFDLVGAAGSLPREFIVDVSGDDLVAGLARFYEADYFETVRDAVRAEDRERVDFVGAIPQKDVHERLTNAAVLVNPSYSESFGMTVVEAMACGIPVVATRVGGMQETVVHGETGLFVDRNDPAALAEAINQLLSDSTWRRALGRAGRERVLASFSWDRIAERTMDRYRALTEPAGHAEVSSGMVR
jgi:glycosyltransferase involved in cell wall biosynthesis